MRKVSQKINYQSLTKLSIYLSLGRQKICRVRLTTTLTLLGKRGPEQRIKVQSRAESQCISCNSLQSLLLPPFPVKVVFTSHCHSRTLDYTSLWPNPEFYSSQTWEVKNEFVSATEGRHKATEAKKALSTHLPAMYVSTTAPRLLSQLLNTQQHTICRHFHHNVSPHERSLRTVSSARKVSGLNPHIATFHPSAIQQSSSLSPRLAGSERAVGRAPEACEQS